MNQQLPLFASASRRGILADLLAFRDFGEATHVETQDGVPYYTNEFWTARQRQAHRLHEVSYRACFKPQLPAFFIDRLTAPGDIVHDPFMGRGTTPIEAAIRGRVPFGNDINPLSRALAEPRVATPDLPDVLARLESVPWSSFGEVTRDDLLAFYHPRTLAGIEGLRRWLLDRQARGEFDAVDAWVRMVAINRLTGHSSGFLSVYTLPPNQATSVQAQRRINEKRGQVPPERDVPGILARKSRALLADGGVRTPRRMFLTGPAERTPEIPDGAVTLTVTSPPFLDIVNYAADNWLRCWFLGIDAEGIRLDIHRTLPDWRAFTARTLAELARVTRAGGHVAYEVGEVRKGTVRLEREVIEAARGLPFETLGVIVNAQAFTKTSNCWGVSNNEGGTNTNRIVLLRRLP